MSSEGETATLLRVLGLKASDLMEAQAAEERLASHPPGYIFGAGSCAQQVSLGVQRTTNTSPIHVVDDAYFEAAREAIGGKSEVVSFSQFASLSAASKGRTDVLCGVVQPQFSFATAQRRFRESASAFLIPSVWNRAYLSDGDGFSLWSRQHVLENAGRYVAAFEVMADVMGREVLKAHLRMRLVGDWSGVNNLCVPPYSDIPFLTGAPGGWLLIDCGAHTGDSLDWIYSNYPNNWNRVVAVEPEPLNMSSLRDASVVRKLRARGVSVDLVQAAVSHEVGHAQFLAGAGTASRVMAGDITHGGATIEVETVTLQDLLGATRNRGQVLVKMDIEGSEVPVCRTAIHALESAGALVAVSAYHRDSDLIDLLDVLSPSAGGVSLRQFGYDGTDLSLIVLLK